MAASSKMSARMIRMMTAVTMAVVGIANAKIATDVRNFSIAFLLCSQVKPLFTSTRRLLSLFLLIQNKANFISKDSCV